MVMIDAISRMVPGVLNNDVSAETETFHNDLLEYPQYTRPEVWHEKSVPEVLLSGNHKKITQWRLEQSVERTKIRRPDLYKKYQKNQEVIKRLLKKKRIFIHMAEFLSRGLGEINYAEGYNLCIGNSMITLLSAESKEDAEILIKKQCKNFAQTIITPQEFVKDILLEANGEWKATAYIQACYTNKVPLHVSYKDIRVTEDGTIAAYKNEAVIGKIEIMPDGSLGCPCTGRLCDNKEVTESLLAYAINKQIFDMQTPFIRVEEKEKALLEIIGKMGLYFSDIPIWLMTK